MKATISIIITFFLLALVGIAWATATGETKDKKAVPKVAYGKTTGGDLKPILVDDNGIIQIS